MDENTLKTEIIALERSKSLQYSDKTREKIEQQIIDLVNDHLKGVGDYAAMITEYHRLNELKNNYSIIVNCTLALDKAIAASGAAVGAHIADLIIPGEIGTIASAEASKNKENKQSIAKALFDEINDGKKYGIRLGDVSMSEMLRTMDMIFDAFRKKGLDITSAASAYNSFMERGDYKKAALKLKEIALRIEAFGLKQKVSDLEDKIEMRIQAVRNRLTPVSL